MSGMLAIGALDGKMFGSMGGGTLFCGAHWEKSKLSLVAGDGGAGRPNFEEMKC